MSVRSALSRPALRHRLPNSLTSTASLARRPRSLTTQPTPTSSSPSPSSSSSSSSPSPPPPPENRPESEQPPPQTWLTRKIKENPAAKQAFFALLNVLGYGSAKQYAGRRAFAMYSGLCVPRPDEEAEFWKEECHLPPTFQSWFTITNLHVWLLTVRLRALPPPLGTNYVQGLIDHFFLDVEDRVRAVLQPAAKTSSLTPSQNTASYTRPTDFYQIANAPSGKWPRGNAPETLVTRQMKIFREQWAGMGMSFDLGLVRGDPELAAAVWRNMLGARGARGIAYPSGLELDRRFFRRTVNLAGGKVEKGEKLESAEGALQAEEARDDGSGLHDHPPLEVDKYLAYPELMATVVEYVRRELVRLERIPDELFIGQQTFGTENEGLESIRFGPVCRDDGLVAALRATP